MHRKAFALIILAATLPFAASVLPSIAAAGAPALTQPDALTWVPAPGLPPGAQLAVLYGDPSKQGPFAMRLKFPAGYEVATHSHPTDELITVVSGAARMAFGEDARESDAQPIKPGTFTSLPAGSWHKLWVDSETVVELHSTGPFDTHLH
jgi:quercetin dioxygenase-like cupin family protein